jgi:hypothetical protein
MNRFKMLIALTLAFGLAAGAAWAGSRTAEVAVVAVHDDSDPGSKACLRRVIEDLRGGESEVKTVSRAKLLKAAGAADGEGLLSWTGAQLRAAAGDPNERGRDLVVAVDCRPAAGVLRVVAITEALSADPARINFRFDAGGSVDRARMDLAARMLSNLVWRDINY